MNVRISALLLDGRRFPAAPRRSPRPLGWRLLLVAAVLVCPGVARAQLSVESLTGSDTGAYFQDVQDAIKKFATRDIEGTRALLEVAREKSPKLAPPEVLLARMFLSINQASLARAELEKAVKKYPDDPDAYAAMGALALAEGRPAESRQMYVKALQVVKDFQTKKELAKFSNPKRAEKIQTTAYATIGAVDEDRENWIGARGAYKRWVDLDPKSAAAHQRYARALFMSSDLPEAERLAESEKEFTKMNELDPKSPPVELSLANLYRQQKENDKADEQIKKAAKTQAKNIVGQIAVSQYYMMNGQFDEAKQHAEAALKLDPLNVEAKLTLGIIARMTKDYDTAEKYLEQAHLAAPTNIQVNNSLALVLIEKSDKNDNKRALEFAELNARLYPSNTELVATLGWINFRLDRTAEAERELLAVIQANSFTADSAYFVATAFQDQSGRTEQLSQLLTNTLDNGKAFSYRKESEELLAKLKKRLAEKTEKGGSAKRPAGAKTVP